MITLTKDDIRAVAEEVVKQLRPILAVERQQVEISGPEEIRDVRDEFIPSQRRLAMEAEKVKTLTKCREIIARGQERRRMKGGK